MCMNDKYMYIYTHVHLYYGVGHYSTVHVNEVYFESYGSSEAY